MLVDEIIRGCLAGKQSHFDELYKKYSSGLYGICLRYSGDEEEAKDILQEGFVRVFRQLRSFDSKKGTFEGWLKRIFINLSIDYFRKKHPTKNSFSIENLGGDIPDEENDLEYNITHEQVLKLIQDLPQGYRTVFNLFAIDNKKHKEISEMLGISENTSKTQFLKARRLLQSRILQIVVANQSDAK